MIVPSRALLVAYALTIPALVLIASRFQEARTAGLLIAIFLAAVAAIDALTASFSLKGVSFGVNRIIRMTRLRPGRIEIEISHNVPQIRTIRLGLKLPDSIGLENDIAEAAIPPGQGRIKVIFTCLPKERGPAVLDSCHAEGLSFLKLWLFRKPFRLKSEIRVYPGLEGERKALAPLFLNRGLLGIHRMPQTGKGREFEKLREYIPGDSSEDIHWKVTAKRHQPVTKVFRVERTQDVYVVIDSSRLSARPAAFSDHNTGESCDAVLEKYISSALVIGLAAQKEGDNFGLISFSDQVHGFLKARSGRPHYGSCRELICSIKPRLVNPDFEELFTFIRLNLRRRALIIFLTALDDPVLAEGFSKNINLVSRTHLVAAGMIRPENARPLFSETAVAGIDGIYSALAGHYIWHNLTELNKVLARQGVGFSMYGSSGLSAGLVNRYLQIKGRQML
jgi:uncharacterized protein (DUF58 family)